jgi:hypothetical protein
VSEWEDASRWEGILDWLEWKWCSSEIINLVAWQPRTCVCVVVRIFVLRVVPVLMHHFLPYTQDLNDRTTFPEKTVNLRPIDTTVIII